MTKSKTLDSSLLGTQLRFTSECHVRPLTAFPFSIFNGAQAEKRPGSAMPCVGYSLAVQCFGTGKGMESVAQNGMAPFLSHSEAPNIYL